jgi:hypothetical protein
MAFITSTWIHEAVYSMALGKTENLAEERVEKSMLIFSSDRRKDTVVRSYLTLWARAFASTGWRAQQRTGITRKGKTSPDS